MLNQNQNNNNNQGGGGGVVPGRTFFTGNDEHRN